MTHGPVFDIGNVSANTMKSLCTFEKSIEGGARFCVTLKPLQGDKDAVKVKCEVTKRSTSSEVEYNGPCPAVFLMRDTEDGVSLDVNPSVDMHITVEPLTVKKKPDSCDRLKLLMLLSMLGE